MTTDRTPPPPARQPGPDAALPAPLPDPRGGFRLPQGSDQRASDQGDQPAPAPQVLPDNRSARDRQTSGAEGAPRRDPAADGTFSSTPPRGTQGPAGAAMEPAGHPRHEEPAEPAPAAPAGPATTGSDSTPPGSGTLGARPGTSGAEAERLRYVGAATRRIARGLDLDEILLGLCRSAVPAFADAILVYLRDPLPVGDERPSGPLVLRLRRADGGLDEQPSGQSYVGTVLPPVPAEPAAYGGAAESTLVRLDGPLAEVLRGVRPVFAEHPQSAAALEELLRFGEGPSASAGASRPGERPGLHPEAGAARTDRNDGPQHTPVLPTGRRAILAPLRGRRRVIGAAVLLRRPDRPPFESDDLLVAAQLATHTALGVDKAVLYGREAYIADALQREMLPDSLPQPTGVRLASRYLPAAESARVGGDWYDAIPLPGSRVALVVGDVMGHSMTSAAIMGQLRTTVQTLAGLDLAPQEVLYHLDEQAQRLGSDRMATCVYAVYDPIAHRLVVANAGHPPPILLHANGLAEVLRVPPGAPIGVGGVPFEAVELPAPAGATLVLYTDGLVESRTRDVWGGIELLRERLHDAATVLSPPPLEPLCDEILEILGPGDRDDDIALLAARFDGISPSDVAYWYLEPQPQTAGRARRLARQALRRWDLEHLIEPTELLVSEIVTNAVRYAERPITLRLLRTDVLRCEVGDDAPLLPQMRHAQPQDEGGRGLYLVSRMAQRWGATRLSAGKVVWFELAIP
ncbi:SpoIIE family protein phosphatase [Streptomyces sp. SPB162]|uniref:SpoIIE family protein phosphatase n=1 Tax=Streptomyces sp. SPB162 TaxID=2940560 RepID=UPI00240617BA|nr:SpoIIE family protein phosphatase [Streptomyces sp. SPB162]MDF9815356.1 serine phosphatase RsbU (regulator of sigma subunit)/anti-sigma regulatory factor (Ser/Thr protein kinase) [Streptomyces sp. SPB162]